MKHLLILATLVLGLALTVPAYAYDFSPAERALADNPTLSQSNSIPQWQRDQQQAERQSQENERLHNQIHQSPQFNPQAQEYNSNAPWNLYQNGRTSVCRRGTNGSVWCQ